MKDEFTWTDYPRDGTNFEAWIETPDLYNPAHVIMNCTEEDDWRCSHRYTDRSYKIVYDFGYGLKPVKFDNSNFVQVFKTRDDYFNRKIALANEVRREHLHSLDNINDQLLKLQVAFNEDSIHERSPSGVCS